MKKSIISILLCSTFLLVTIMEMTIIPVAAFCSVDFLALASLSGNDATPENAYSFINGDLVFHATSAGQEVTLTVDDAANLNTFPYAELIVSSTTPFDIAFYDPYNNKRLFGANDFYKYFDENLSWKSPLPAGDYDVRLGLTYPYTYNYDPLPANAAIESVTFIAKGSGSITVSMCAITNGMTTIDLNSRGDQSATVWKKRINLIDGDYVSYPPKYSDSESDITFTKNSDGSVTYGNTDGAWPEATYTFDTPIIVDASAALDLDFSIMPNSQASIYIYFGPSTPSNHSDGAYIWLANPTSVLTSDLYFGHYKGVIYLEDTLRKTIANRDATDLCYDENGNFVITGISIVPYSSTANRNILTVRNLDLVSVATSPSIQGDINNDGEFDINDATAVFYWINRLTHLSENQLTNADMNNDGKVSLFDAARLFYTVSGLL